MMQNRPSLLCVGVGGAGAAAVCATMGAVGAMVKLYDRKALEVGPGTARVRVDWHTGDGHAMSPLLGIQMSGPSPTPHHTPSPPPPSPPLPFPTRTRTHVRTHPPVRSHSHSRPQAHTKTQWQSFLGSSMATWLLVCRRHRGAQRRSARSSLPVRGKGGTRCRR